jgi:hypothetical protein
MQNVGLIVGFRLVDRVCPNATIPGGDDFARELLACGRQLSAGIARHWEFPDEVTEAIANAGDPGDLHLAQALSLGVAEDDDLVTEGLDSFQRRCLGKLSHLEA